MSSEDYFWKAFEATGSPQVYMLYNSQKNRIQLNNNERENRNTGF